MKVFGAIVPFASYGGGVAVEVEGAGGLEGAAEFDEARGHHGEVGHHVVRAEEFHEGAHDAAELVAAQRKLLVGALALAVPLPRVLEGLDLCRRGSPFLPASLFPSASSAVPSFSWKKALSFCALLKGGSR